MTETCTVSNNILHFFVFYEYIFNDCALCFQIKKPVIEKRRRERINDSLNTLKALVLDAMQKDVSSCFFTYHFLGSKPGNDVPCSKCYWVFLKKLSLDYIGKHLFH